MSHVTTSPSLSLARLPPLTALRAFVVTSRHHSFSDAARELHVTPAAVGQQVRLLEEHLQQPLFRRARGRLELTEAAILLLPHLDRAFDHFQQAFVHLVAHRDEATLRVAATPSFAAKWLMPRLDRVREAMPRLRICIEATNDSAVIEDGQADCAIVYGAGHHPGSRAERLFGEAILPVCTPAFAERLRSEGDVRSLSDVTLLQEDGAERHPRHSNWAHWMGTGRVPQGDLARVVRLGSPSLVLDAALAGQGIALGKLRLAEPELEARRLVSPFGQVQTLETAYHFVSGASDRAERHVAAFRLWLREEMRIAHGSTGILAADPTA
ncbi:LysR substrate-binding domain-containing protein [Antarcticirhabdus aurantiaca]|uniref:LysR substrate-binding domain-containing protein n=1 Tax=Antarcticirhabdus aurantiaca TaxID=2606717 RepID=A0ACD4NMX3_9HYPH|nr:LysR substrate-binding domain-containing protein [Antarcticirhabdus aurantiaca]WAJ28212.1 LysR substrate-binding domain-containing protein [Jeongeuplla avenae]